ncbi:MAG: transposase [Salinibacter sp.]
MRRSTVHVLIPKTNKGSTGGRVERGHAGSVPVDPLHDVSGKGRSGGMSAPRPPCVGHAHSSSANGITPSVENVLYPALRVKARDSDGRILRLGGISDHVHLVVALRPTVAVSDFVRVVKTGNCSAVREQFGPEAFRWQRGYSAFTVAPPNLQGVLDYVGAQEERHASGQLWSAYERTSQSD